MKRLEREVPVEPLFVPPGLAEAVAGMEWARPAAGEAAAAVHRLYAPGRPTLYLKQGSGDAAEDIAAEMVRLRWLGRHTATPEMLGFVATPDEAWLLTSAVPGRTAFEVLETEPDRRAEIVTALAEHLRALHAVPAEECPFNSAHTLRLSEARKRMEAGEVDLGDFDPERAGWTAERVWAQMTAMLPIEPDPVVTHGDCSLDNILLEDGKVTGLIDLGRVGVADRYQDLAILWNGLGDFGAGLQARLFTAYGIAEPDIRKLRFHLALDEFF